MKETYFSARQESLNFNPMLADNQALYDFSLAHSTGDAEDVDIIAAHICLNIATMRGCQDSAEFRKELAMEMSASEIALAQKEARTMMMLMKKSATH